MVADDAGPVFRPERAGHLPDLVEAVPLEPPALQTQFTFRCVPIPDMQVRNRLEHSLIATIAACQECQPSPAWLGSFAYMPKVQTSGLWNAEGVGGPTITEDELGFFLG